MNFFCLWPLKEAYFLWKKLKKQIPKKKYVLFETGYGPSGVPHIGTFCEIIRTSMVRKAFIKLTGLKTKLFCISDDMDGLKKIPYYIKKNFKFNISKTLSTINDPYNLFKSYSSYMNARLKYFLEKHYLEYELISSTKYYKYGNFNKYLKIILTNYNKIISILLPTLRTNRKNTYSIFLPICKITKNILYKQVIGFDKNIYEIIFYNCNNKKIKQSILNGQCKLQWKIDFAMRWIALDVDYEIYGNDIQSNAYLYNKICILLGKKTPKQMSYELFVDEFGKKISKSKGNGIRIEEWLYYGHFNSLKLFMYQSPKKIKKISYNIIPIFLNKYLRYLNLYIIKSDNNNPIHFIHEGPLENIFSINFSSILNIVNNCDNFYNHIIYNYINKFYITLLDKNIINILLKYTKNYYYFILSKKKYETINKSNFKLFANLYNEINYINYNVLIINNILYFFSSFYKKKCIKLLYKNIYQILIGKNKGIKISSFIKNYSIKRTKHLILIKLNISIH